MQIQDGGGPAGCGLNSSTARDQPIREDLQGETTHRGCFTVNSTTSQDGEQ